MLSKQRTKLKEVDVSGAAASSVNKARKALEELNYFSWLFPFVKVRKKNANQSLGKEGGYEAFDEDENKTSMKENRIRETRIAKTKVMKDITMKINTK